MTPDQNAAQTQDLQVAAREMDFENYTKQKLNLIQTEELEITEQELLADKGWVYASKVLSEWNTGKPFEGTDEEAAHYGLREMSSFNYTFFNVDMPWNDDDSHGLVSYMSRLKDAGDHQKFAFSYLSEVFDAKDPTTKGFMRALGGMAQDPASIASVAMPLALIGRWGGRQAAKSGIKYTMRKWAQDIISKRMAPIGAVDGATVMAGDDYLRQDVEDQYYPVLGREVPTDRASVIEGYDRTAKAALTGAGIGYLFVRGGPMLWKLSKKFVAPPGQTNMGMVYHGTPHKWETGMPDPAMIGTGEGHMAYGHGIYVAENPDTAKFYSPRDLDWEAKLLERYGAAERRQDYVEAEVLEGFMLHRSAKELREQFSDEGYPPEFRDQTMSIIDDVEKMDKSGNVYEMNIPDEDIDRMLDWDKPLSQQSPSVLKALDDMAKQMGDWSFHPDEMPSDWTGADLYTYIAGYFAETSTGKQWVQWHDNPVVGDGPYNAGYSGASEWLAEAGIPGIRYLDAQSRHIPDEKGTRNFVVFGREILDKMKVLN